MSWRIIPVFVAIFIYILPIGLLAQQSTTGPEPPPGLDLGSTERTRAQVIIQGVPVYLWHHGCGPTAYGMIIGYWDMHGRSNLVPGESNVQNMAVNAMIATDNGNEICGYTSYQDHYRSYSCPRDDSGPVQPDKSETGGAHPSNCLADFMYTSWSLYYNLYGWSYFDHTDDALLGYINYIYPNYLPVVDLYMYSEFSWEQFQAEIDAGRPVGLLVDSDGDGYTDHFIAAIGYDASRMEYGFLNTWDYEIHWTDFCDILPGKDWGIYGFTLLSWEGCVDNDADGFGDPDIPGNNCDPDNCPYAFNPDQSDVDGDLLGDVCDPDADADGLLNENDNCPLVSNPGQEDSDSDEVGDLCDNCLDTPNPGQYDENGDGVGDACDGRVHMHCYDIPDGILGEPYYYEFHAEGGVPPYSWAKINGQFPYGLTFTNGTVAVLQGTPTWISDYNFTLILTDSDSPANKDTMLIRIVITEPEAGCGDANSDLDVNISDAVYIINYVFIGGNPPDPLSLGDANCDGSVNISDAVWIINFVFVGGNDPCDLNGDSIPDC